MIDNIICDKEGIRIDKYLVDSDLEYSRSTIKKMIENEFILVNNEKTKANYITKIGDVISIEEMILDDHEIVAQDIPLDIVYQDDDIVVINKPTGMVVHPGAGAYKDTLVNGLMYHIKDLSRINGEIRPGIVHRIDKETSGLLVVAKNDIAHQKLAAQLSDKSLYRIYLALVHGQILDKNIIIDAPIGRDEKDRTKMAITSKNSRKALTKVKVLEVYNSHSYIEAQLETGRTHQIRIHMNYIKHPVVGDPKYGFKKEDKSFGQYLHAYKLGLIHPTTNEYMEFEAMPPQEFIDKRMELKDE
ncbi:MAG: RluA family pseudouridine synthase [Erysipelotrichales bacterium]